MVTKALLKQLAPNAKPALVDAVVRGWPKAVAAGVTTNRRTRHFLAQIMGETGGLHSISESLTYSSVARIRQVWPTRFKTDASAKPFVKQAKKLAIKVYGGRMGNAPAPSEDGWIYRGGGMLQTTGREGYRKMGFEDNPEALRDPDIAFETAVREWSNRGCNALADKDDVTAIRKKINGGTNGLGEVKTWLGKAEKLWPDDEADAPAQTAPTPKPRPTPPAPKPRPKIYTDEDTVETVQQQLFDLGYTEVGGVDGDIGGMTRAAILIFREDNGLPSTSVIDDELLVALSTAKPRVLAKGREEAPPAVVREKVPEVQANWLGKIIASVVAVIGLISTMIEGVLSNLPGAGDLIEPLQKYASDVPPTVWMLLVTGVAGAIWWINRKGEQKGVAAFQSGERR